MHGSELCNKASRRRRSQMADVDPHSHAVDEQMDRLNRDESPEAEALEPLEGSGKSRVIENREPQLQKVDQRPEKPFDLTEGEVEDPADRERSLDGQVQAGVRSARTRNPPSIQGRRGGPSGPTTDWIYSQASRTGQFRLRSQANSMTTTRRRRR